MIGVSKYTQNVEKRSSETSTFNVIGLLAWMFTVYSLEFGDWRLETTRKLQAPIHAKKVKKKASERRIVWVTYTTVVLP